MDAFSNLQASSCELDPRLQGANWKSQWNSGDRITVPEHYLVMELFS